MKDGGMGKQDMESGAEDIAGLQVEQIKDFSEDGAAIRDLRYDALDTEEDRAAGSRRRGIVKGIDHSLWRPGDRHMLYVAKDGNRVVGFLSIKKSPLGKIGEIEQLWTDHPGQRQRRIAFQLLGTAHESLSRLKMTAHSPSADLMVVAHESETGKFLRIVQAPGEEPIDIPIAKVPEDDIVGNAANDNIPEAANDNESIDKAAQTLRKK